MDVSFNKLTVLSGELSALDGLSILNLGYNALGSLPDVVSCMTCLRELNLDSTGVQGVKSLHSAYALPNAVIAGAQHPQLAAPC